MDILNMEYFIAVCNYRNITKAASILHLSQSALSRRIQSLEEELGLTLLVRGGHYIELTPAGERFLKECEKIVGRQKRLLMDLELYRHEGSIRLGYAPGIYMPGLLRLVMLLRKRQPEIAFQFVGNSMYYMVQDLIQGKLDLIYTTYGEVEALPHIRHMTLVENALSVLVPRDHPLGKKSTLSCQDLMGAPLCMEDAERSSLTTAARVLEWLDENGMDSANVTLLSSASEVLLHVVSGRGLGLTGIYVRGETSPHSDYVKNIPLLEGQQLRYGDFVLAYREDNPTAVEFMEKLQAIL